MVLLFWGCRRSSSSLLAVARVLTGAAEGALATVTVLTTGTEGALTVLGELTAGAELATGRAGVVVELATGTELATGLTGLTSVGGIDTELTAVQLTTVGLLDDLVGISLLELNESVALGAALGVLGEVGVLEGTVLGEELLSLVIGGAPGDVANKELLGGIGTGGHGVAGNEGQTRGSEGQLCE